MPREVSLQPYGVSLRQRRRAAPCDRVKRRWLNRTSRKRLSSLSAMVQPIGKTQEYRRCHGRSLDRLASGYDCSYAFFNQPMSCLSTPEFSVTRTRWLTIALKLPEASSRSVASTSFRLTPTSTRVFVDGWTIANCLFRRRLTYAFFGEISTSLPNFSTALMRAS